jgi:ribulose-phosphate 3-epimerase
MVSQKALISLLPIYLQFPPKYVTVHEEANKDWSEIAKQIRAKGARFGLALNPETPISTIQNCLSSLDLVLIMSVVPGKGGQKFLDSTYQKLQDLDDLREKDHLTFLIQIDGGINLEISKKLISKGANLLVIGSDLIKDPNPVTYINHFHDL